MKTIGLLIFVMFYLFIRTKISKYYFNKNEDRTHDIKNYRSNKYKIINENKYYALVKNNKKINDKVMIVAHGNAGSFLDREYLLNNLNNYDGDIYIIEYSGFSGIGGEISIKNCIEDIFYWICKVNKQYKYIDLYGESIGGGLIIETYNHYKLNKISKYGVFNINNIYLQSTFTSMSDVLYDLDYKLYLLYKFLLMDDLNTLKNIKNIKCNNVIIIHSKTDQLINFTHALRNYNEFKKHNINVKLIHAVGDHQHAKFTL